MHISEGVPIIVLTHKERSRQAKIMPSSEGVSIIVLTNKKGFRQAQRMLSTFN